MISETVTTLPTIGFNVETVNHKNVSFTVWDIGYRERYRPLWRHYYQNTQGIIFVVDSNDRERIDDSSGCSYSAKDLLYSLLDEEELCDASVLIFANKQDLPNAMSINEVKEKLSLNMQYGRLWNRNWHIQSTCGTTGDGLREGLDWLVSSFGLKSSFMTPAIEWADGVKESMAERQRQKEAEERAERERERLAREKEEELRRVNETKTILLVSGWIRSAVSGMNLFLDVPAGIAKEIHDFYRDPKQCHEAYSFYGEVADISDEVHWAKPDMLMQFVNRRHDDPNYMKDDDAFIQFITENGQFPSEIYGDDDVQFEWMVYKKEDIEWMKHYDFMRMIWIFQTKYDRRNGMKQIWKYTPFNTTKTYFWAQSIYFGLKNSSSEGTLGLLSSDFEYLLIMNPHLVQEYEHLMERYYSESLLAVIDEEKKEEMVLPDLLPLPSIMTDIARLKAKKANEQQTKINAVESKQSSFAENDDDDDSFIKSFESRIFKCWSGHKSFIRVIWCYVNQYGTGKGAADKVRSEWKSFRSEDYHETIIYFWIHMVRYWTTMFRNEYVDHNESEWTFKSFIAFCEKSGNHCNILDANWWTQYFSDSVMYHKGFHDVDASKEIVFPDKMQLPQLKLTKVSPR